MTQPGPMRRAVAYALKGAPEEQKYAGTRALVRRYAMLLDAADELDEGWREALGRLVAMANDGEAVELAKRIERRLRIANAADVTSDLGPKLLQALTAMGMTVGQGQAAGGGVSRGAAVTTTFDEVRAKRAERARKRRAATMDATPS